MELATDCAMAFRSPVLEFYRMPLREMLDWHDLAAEILEAWKKANR